MESFGATPIPLTPRTIRPPNPPRNAISGGTRHGQLPYLRTPTERSSATSDPSSYDVIGLCKQLLEEVRRIREEIKKQGEDIKKMNQNFAKLDENYKRLRDDFKEHNETTFSIESSVYKDGLIKEAGALFAKSLTRQPSQEDIGQSVMKVLGAEGRNKTKFNKAKTFCSNRLTDLRCEERRRLFGNKPCEAFPQYTTEKFVDKMQSIIKANNVNTGLYMKHVALLRKFTREVPDAKKDTYKRFRDWVDQYFAGSINNEVWEQILTEDSHNHGYQPEVALEYEVTGQEDVIQTQYEEYANT